MPVSSLKPIISSFQPTANRILAIRKADAATSGPIHLPMTMMRTGLQECLVVAVGPDVLDVKKADRILIHRQLSFTKIDIDGTIHDILPEDQVLGLVED